MTFDPLHCISKQINILYVTVNCFYHEKLNVIERQMERHTHTHPPTDPERQLKNTIVGRAMENTSFRMILRDLLNIALTKHQFFWLTWILTFVVTVQQAVSWNKHNFCNRSFYSVIINHRNSKLLERNAWDKVLHHPGKTNNKDTVRYNLK